MGGNPSAIAQLLQLFSRQQPQNAAVDPRGAPPPDVLGGQARQDYYAAQAAQNRPTSPTGALIGAAGANPQSQASKPKISDDAAQAAVKAAKTKYPRFANIPIKLTSGSGPGWSETYEPEDEENPHPGRWTVQLRSDKALAGNYDSTIGFEMIHALQRDDPNYQKFTDKFVKSMTPQQLADSKRAYEQEKTMFGNPQPFDKWLPRVQAQEYIRGGIFTDVIPNWVGPKGIGKYTPEQTQLLGQIKNYLQTPASNGQQTDQRK